MRSVMLLDKNNAHIGDVVVGDDVEVVIRHDTRLDPWSRAFRFTGEVRIRTLVFKETEVHYLTWEERGLDGEPHKQEEFPAGSW